MRTSHSVSMAVATTSTWLVQNGLSSSRSQSASPSTVPSVEPIGERIALKNLLKSARYSEQTELLKRTTDSGKSSQRTCPSADHVFKAFRYLYSSYSFRWLEYSAETCVRISGFVSLDMRINENHLSKFKSGRNGHRDKLHFKVKRTFSTV